MDSEQASGGTARATSASSEIPTSTRRVDSAVGWSFVMNAVRMLSTLGTAFLLAAMLGPEAFGTVALALLFITLVQLLIQQGFIPAIVQRPGLTWRHLDSAFWLSIALSLSLVAVSLLVGPWWARLNNTPEAKTAIWALSSLILVKGLVVVQEAYLQRDLQFRALAIRTTIASLVGAVVGVTWALVRPSIWALVAQQIVTAVVGAAVIWTLVSWRPRFTWHAQDARDLLGFAGKSTLSSLGVFVNTRVDAVLVGVYFGALAVGLYQLAYRLVRTAIDSVIYPIAGVSLADLARHQDDPKRLVDRYLTLVGVTAVVGGALMATIFASARPLMATVGPEWSDAAPALQLLTIVGLVTILGMVNSPALQAVGRPGAQAAIVWVGAVASASTFVIAGALLTGATTGAQVVGMAGSRVVVYVVLLLPLSQAMISRCVGARPSQFIGVVLRPVIASALGAGAGLLLGALLAYLGVPSAIALIAVGGSTLAITVVLLLLATPHARLVYDRVLDRIPDRMVPPTIRRIRLHRG